MVEYLDIQDVKYPVIINFFVIGEFQKETGQSFSDFNTLQDKLYFVEPLLYHAIRIGQLVTKVPITIKREDMPFLLSDNDVYTKFLALIPSFFPQNTENNSKKK